MESEVKSILSAKENSGSIRKMVSELRFSEVYKRCEHEVKALLNRAVRVHRWPLVDLPSLSRSSCKVSCFIKLYNQVFQITHLQKGILFFLYNTRTYKPIFLKMRRSNVKSDQVEFEHDFVCA